MHFPLFPRPRRRVDGSPGVIPIQELGLQKTRVCIARNRRREERRTEEINEGARACRGGKGGNRAWVGEGALKRRHRAKCSRDKNRHDRRFALENGGLERTRLVEEEEEAKPFSENAANGLDGWATAPSRNSCTLKRGTSKRGTINSCSKSTAKLIGEKRREIGRRRRGMG